MISDERLVYKITMLEGLNLSDTGKEELDIYRELQTARQTIADKDKLIERLKAKVGKEIERLQQSDPISNYESGKLNALEQVMKEMEG